MIQLSEIGFLRYNAERGEVQTLMDGIVRHAIEVRRGLEDQMVLVAVVEELRRRGYLVVRPDGPPGSLREAIALLQDRGYVVREAKDFEAELEARRG